MYRRLAAPTAGAEVGVSGTAAGVVALPQPANNVLLRAIPEAFRKSRRERFFFLVDIFSSYESEKKERYTRY
jgi:hypothetical protein